MMKLLCAVFALLFISFPSLAIGGGSWSCDGTSDGYALFDHNSAYNSDLFSISLWIQQGSAGSVFPAVFTRNNEAASPSWNWYIQMTNSERTEIGWNSRKTTTSNLFDAYSTTNVDGVWYRYQMRLQDNGATRQLFHTQMGKAWENSGTDGETNPNDFTDAPINLCRLSVIGTYRYDFDGKLAHVEFFDDDIGYGGLMFNYWHPGIMRTNQVMYLPLTGASIVDASATGNDPSTTGTGMAAEDDGPPLGWHGGLGF